MKTPLRYAGGKTRAIKKITPYVANHSKIVSPFIGGGSLEVYWASIGHQVIGYDIFFALTNFWQILLHRKEELINSMRTLNVTLQEYNAIKEKLLSWDRVQEMLKGHKTKHYIRTPIQLDDVTAAAYYFFNHNLSYGPLFLGWISKNYNSISWKRMIEKIQEFYCPNLEVYESSFEDVLERHRNDFLYLDPPYFLERDADNKMFSGVYPNRNIPIHHDGFDHIGLRDLLKKHKGNFVLSYNNCETIRDYYSEYHFAFPKWSYSLGNGEVRIGRNRQKSLSNVKDSHEILIFSEDIRTIDYFC